MDIYGLVKSTGYAFKVLETSLGLPRKALQLQVKCLPRANFTLDQEKT